ncbi:MAG: DNA cytosine methyltransferase [Clostridia bacterium]|nr:DNA cytosine methyltransferase [Clostridia bacterium]
MNVQNAGSISVSYNWKWYLKDLDAVEKNGLKVFSCFSCGGGSSMGYKLAGYTVIGNCEIDHAMNKVYVANHHPKYNYNMDVREFGAIDRDKLPEDLLHLDILDGSPPCSVFSSAGEREKGWNTEKQFREGQKMQRLDDLFFWFIDIAKKLQPKVVIAENVKGLTAGNAKGYVNEIFKAFRAAGYKPQMFLMNGASMGVPQRRERVFFLAQRNDLDLPKIQLGFHEKPILFGEVRSEGGVPLKEGSRLKMLLDNRKPTDRKLADINERLSGQYKGFTNYIWSDDQVCGTIASGGSYFRMYDGMGMSKQDFINVQTFPQDYDFIDQPPQYVCGMSVPPVMMARIAKEVERQWLRPGDSVAD